MKNKILILDDSVTLFEHYMGDERWERTLSYPRGGLTYLVSNGTIKFFAYQDYFYKNCIMSMPLPIYIVDEYMHIDGEYSDITELTQLLDRIFPFNDVEAELVKYLKVVDAELLYQPIGDYALKSDIPSVSGFVTTEELVDVLDDYYTKTETDDKYQPKGDYQEQGDYVSGSTFSAYTASTDTAIDGKLDASAYTPTDLSNYYTKTETDNLLDDKLDASAYTPSDLSNYYTKTESDGKYQDKLIAGSNIIISGNVISAVGGSGFTVDAYSKSESDAKYQPKGNYVTSTELANTLNYYVTENWITNQNYITTNQVNTYVTNLQEQINSLQEALERCCSGSPTPTPTIEYRWITLTGSSDYLCLGTSKYEKQQKQQSEDGINWTDVSPADYKRGNLIETSSVDCGAAPPITDRRWVEVDDEYICLDYNKYEKWKLQYSYDSGATWVDSDPLQTTNGGLVESNSRDCGYEGCKFCATVYLSGNAEPQYPSTEVEYYDGVLNIKTTKQGWWYTNSSAITSVTFNTCVTSIDDNAFTAMDGYHSYINLAYVDLPSTITRIGLEAFKTKYGGVCKLKTVIIRATTPPLMSVAYEYFSTDGGLKIYVPDEAVNAYKNAQGWSTRYGDRIYPISSLNS